MSEYIEIETEESDDGRKIFVYTNLLLADGDIEDYDSRDSLEEGSPVAQALAIIDGIAHLRIDSSDLIITREPGTEWYVIVEDVSAVLKDFFL
jgi:hypothetical protein